MKTIKVIFTNDKLPLSLALKKKQYSFNVNENVKEGDLLTSDSYNAKLQVTKVHEEYYRYYYPGTGVLTNGFNNEVSDIKELIFSGDSFNIKSSPSLL